MTFDKFLELTEIYAKHLGVPLTTVSSRLFNDSKRLDMLRDDAGRDVGIRKVEVAVQWLSDNWPKGCAWPKGVIRPARTAAGAES